MPTLCWRELLAHRSSLATFLYSQQGTYSFGWCPGDLNGNATRV